MVQPVRAESDWQEEWGGALRIFTERRMDCERYSGTVLPESTRSTSTSEAHVDVLPEAGTQIPRAFATQTISAMLDTLAAAEPENW